MTPLVPSWARRYARPHSSTLDPASDRLRLLILLEGIHDIEFLKRVGGLLHAHNAHVPNLSLLERRGAVAFVPIGGGDWSGWACRLASLRLAEFHLYDRDVPPVSQLREQCVELVNGRRGCRAFVTAKRALENYLHPNAIRAARGVEVAFGDHDPVADCVAQACRVQRGERAPWSDLPVGTRKRLRNRAKRWLNTRAVECMTTELLAQRDPQGEVLRWFAAIAELLDT